MAKKKLRYKRRKSKCVNIKSKDRHHLCWQRRMWNRGALKELRNFHYCIIEIEKNKLHHHIHTQMSCIPAPKEIAAREALEQLRYLEGRGTISDADPIEKRLMLLAALFDCADQTTADAFRKQLDIVHKFKKAPL